MKAVLVIEMPEHCMDCKLYRFGGCQAENKLLDFEEKHKIERPSWCPLKKLPDKKVPYGSDLFNDYVRGYNDCRDDVEKESYGGFKTTGVESVKPIEQEYKMKVCKGCKYLSTVEAPYGFHMYICEKYNNDFTIFVNECKRKREKLNEEKQNDRRNS